MIFSLAEVGSHRVVVVVSKDLGNDGFWRENLGLGAPVLSSPGTPAMRMLLQLRYSPAKRRLLGARRYRRLLGLDHEKLTYRHSGRDFRLTDVHGTVMQDIIA